MTAATIDWSDAAIKQLRALWDEGLSTAEIGRRLGITKNAVIGKAHRESFPARPSPILPRCSADGQPKPRAPKLILPALAVQRPMGGTAIVARTLPIAPVQEGGTVFLPRKCEPCCWPMNDRRPWRYCDVDTVPGRSYCAEHMAVGWVKVKRPKGEAAHV